MESTRAFRPSTPSPGDTAFDMVVDHAGRLHERVADRRPDERKPALLERFAHRVRVGELPDELVEAPEFLLHREKRLRISDRAFDFQPVANEPLVLEK